MLIALTGATGFIGRRLCTRLADDGHTVRALARDPDAAARILDPRVTIIGGDLRCAEALRQLVHNADAVMHLAGAVRGACARDFDTVNLDGTRTLLEALQAAAPAAPLLHFSSLAAREPGLSHYASSKHRAEVLVRAHAGARPCLILRPPAVYGPGDREMLPVFRFMSKTGLAPATAPPGARLSLIFVDDLVEAVRAWLARGAQLSATLTLHDGRDRGYDWPAIAEIVTRACGRRVRIWPVPRWLIGPVAWANARLSRALGYLPMLTPGKLRELRHPDWVCDNDAISLALDWKPGVQLGAGLERTPGWRD